MSNLIPVTRDEMQGLRDLVRNWERVALDNEQELITLRSFRSRALSLFRRLAAASKANDPITLERLIAECEQEVVGE